MGVTRKFLSACTGGLIDFRSDKERVARSARKTLRETRRLRKAQERAPRAVTAGAQGWPQAGSYPVGAVPGDRAVQQMMTGRRAWPPGWYHDFARPGTLWWWDGQNWTGQTMDDPNWRQP